MTIIRKATEKTKEATKTEESGDTSAMPSELICSEHNEVKVQSWFGLICPRCLNECLDEISMKGDDEN